MFSPDDVGLATHDMLISVCGLSSLLWSATIPRAKIIEHRAEILEHDIIKKQSGFCNTELSEYSSFKLATFS